MLLLTSHWPELSQMITLAPREAGTCSLHLDGPVTISGTIAEEEGESGY